jgi:hypothetical protein
MEEQYFMYAVVLLPSKLWPLEVLPPYFSPQDPGDKLPLFHSQLTPADWDRYHQLLNWSNTIDAKDKILRLGNDLMNVAQARTLAPVQWLNKRILHYFTNSLKRTLKIKESSVLFFSSYYLTKWLNLDHANKSLEGRFFYHNVKNWARKKLKASKKPIHEIEVMVSF